MIPLKTFFIYTETLLYSLIVPGMLFLFYKAAKHPNKSYGLLLILILFVSFFACSVLQLIILCLKLDDSDGPLNRIYLTLVRFANLWIICQAVIHYYILISLKGKYKRHPFKAYIFLAVLVSLILAGVTNLQYLKSRRIDPLIVDVFAWLSLGLISLGAYRFKEEIKFGPYSLARDSAAKLMKFSFVQGLFAFVYFFQDGFVYINSCSAKDERNLCIGLRFTDLILYQGWVWWAVFYNWKMFSMKEENENSGNKDYASGNSMTSIDNSALLHADL